MPTTNTYRVNGTISKDIPASYKRYYKSKKEAQKQAKKASKQFACVWLEVEMPNGEYVKIE